MRKNPFQNRLIAIEGIDGTGKSTTCTEVVKRLDIKSEELESPLLDNNTVQLIAREIALATDSVLETECFEGKRFGGAVIIEDVPFRNPIDALDKKSFEDRYGIDLGAHLYLLSAVFKDKAITAILPYLHVICDRYLYSLIARHQALGSNPAVINYAALDLLKPDLFYQLRVEEIERLRRVVARGAPNRIDLIPNLPDSRHGKIEKALTAFSPRIIDTTDRTPEAVAEEIISDFEHHQKKL